VFSVIVDRELFDEYRVITLKLDPPKPRLKPDWECWATQAWAANITQRMRYRELPYWDQARGCFAPIPKMPEATVSFEGGSVLEKATLEKQQCLLDNLFASFFIDDMPEIRSGDELVFSVVYGSGGLFDPIKSQFVLQYDEKKHGWLKP